MHDGYVALGDSTAAGYGTAPGAGFVDRIARLSGAPLTNLATSGARSACVARDQVPRLRARPSLVTVAVGTNDVVYRTPVEALRRTWRRLGVALRALGAPVVVGNVPDLSLAPISALFSPSFYVDQVAALNHLIGETCARHGFGMVDLHQVSRDYPDRAGAARLFGPDGFHPSAEGHAELAAAWWPVVERSLTG